MAIAPSCRASSAPSWRRSRTAGGARAADSYASHGTRSESNAQHPPWQTHSECHNKPPASTPKRQLDSTGQMDDCQRDEQRGSWSSGASGRWSSSSGRSSSGSGKWQVGHRQRQVEQRQRQVGHRQWQVGQQPRAKSRSAGGSEYRRRGYSDALCGFFCACRRTTKLREPHPLPARLKQLETWRCVFVALLFLIAPPPPPPSPPHHHHQPPGADDEQMYTRGN